MYKVVLLGAGEVVRKHWGPVLLNNNSCEVMGIVDPKKDLPMNFPTLQWHAFSMEDVSVDDPDNTIAIVLTPDHLPTVEKAVAAGFTNIICGSLQRAPKFLR